VFRRAVLSMLMATGALHAGEPAPIAASDSSSCAVRVSLADDLDDFYPPGSLRRLEEGEVVIVFRAAPGEGSARDIRISRSSGYAALDDAALRLVRALQVNSPCESRETRWAVHFSHGPEEKVVQPANTDVSFSRVVGKVLLVPDESAAR